MFAELSQEIAEDLEGASVHFAAGGGSVRINGPAVTVEMRKTDGFPADLFARAAKLYSFAVRLD